MMKPSPQKIYLDYAATTPVDRRVLTAMLPYFSELFGNPSSVHAFGQQAENALETARERVAELFHCQPGEVIFTSCGSESDNLALRGAALAARAERMADHILISPVEHHAVSKTALQLAASGEFELELLPVDRYGRVDPGDVANRLRPTTAVVSVIYANNEIGTINPIAEIGAICRNAGVRFHTDAVQAAAYLDSDVSQLNVDLMSLGAHKFYGPKGVGVLYVKKSKPPKGYNLVPIQTGGSQEFGMRAGTQNIPLIVGFTEALSLAVQEREERIQHVLPLRDYLIGHVLESIPETVLTGHPHARMPNHASFAFRDVDGNALLAILDVAGYACSSGSACKTGDPEPSGVLTALGLDRNWAIGSLRVTLGVGTLPEHVQKFADSLVLAVNQARKIA
jgi:cysteine desulfurase